MIRLTAATTDLLRVTPSSTNVVKTVVQFSDKTATAYTGGNEVHSLAAASIATICATPAASTVRDIDHVSLYSVGANTLTVGQTVSGTEYILIVASLLAGEMLAYTHATGWVALDANGNRKEVTSSVFSSLTVTGNETVGGTLGVTGNTTLSGTGNVITGTATNDSAAAGKLGEYIVSSVANASGVSLSTGSPKTITSISLTAGDWDVWGIAKYDGGGTTVVTQFQSAINTSDNLIPADPEYTAFSFGAAGLAVFVSGNVGFPVPTTRISLAGTTTIYLVGLSVFSTSTCKAYGRISARRIR